MKTIRQPKKVGELKIECLNEDCSAIMLCKTSELECSGDCYTGYTYVMTCPHCSSRRYLSSDDLRKCK